MTTSVPLRDARSCDVSAPAPSAVSLDSHGSKTGPALLSGNPAAPLQEKLAHYKRAFFRQDAAHDLDPMVQFSVVQHAQSGPARARLLIPGAKYQTVSASLHDGTCAHDARLDCNIERTTRQAVIAKLPRRPPEGEYFGVRTGIV